MMYAIHMGVPEMEDLWNDLQVKVRTGTANKDEEKLYNLLGKALRLLSQNPRHPGLHTHDIDALTARYGMRVWQSYLQNDTPAAGRVFWVYGPDRQDITIIGLEPHPNDAKSNAYKKITLSKLGKELP